MNENQISSFLAIALAILLVILFVLLAVFITLSLKEKNKDKKKSYNEGKNSSEDGTQIKNGVEYNKNSIFSFMEFEKIEDNMIVKKTRQKYIMVIECQGINYDLMSNLEKNSVEQGFLQFLNTLRYPIQLYVQTRTVNLGSSINRYKTKVSAIRDNYVRRQMEYNTMLNSGTYSQKELNEAKFELVKVQNLYEYGLDIIDNTEKMNLNKNILKKHYYIVISHTPEESTITKYGDDELKNMAFSDLYTKAQALISSIGVCGVSGKVLNSEELAELLYVAYNRDESEVYDLEKAIKAGVNELYATAKNVLDKRMIEINKEIEAKANIKANEMAIEAMMNQDKARKVKQREEQMDELIDVVAKNLLDENEEILGTDVVEDAKELIDNQSK